MGVAVSSDERDFEGVSVLEPEVLPDAGDELISLDNVYDVEREYEADASSVCVRVNDRSSVSVTVPESDSVTVLDHRFVSVNDCVVVTVCDISSV